MYRPLALILVLCAALPVASAQDAPPEGAAPTLTSVLAQDWIHIAPIRLATHVLKQATAVVQVHNKADVAAEVSGELMPDFFGEAVPQHLLRVTPSSVQFTLEPGGMREIEVVVEAERPVPIEQMYPLFTIWKYSFYPEDMPAAQFTLERAILVETDFIIPFRNAPVSVDANLEEWAELPFSAALPAQIRVAPRSWRGTKDCSFRFAVAQDKQYLYLAMRTVDDVPLTKVERPPWYQDGIEIRIDSRPDPERSTWDEYGHEFDKFVFVALLPGDNPQRTILYDRGRLPKGTQVASVRTETGHDTELAIPHEALDAFCGKTWDALRINIAVDDFDSPEGPLAQYWWRPDWRFGLTYDGSGTFKRK